MKASSQTSNQKCKRQESTSPNQFILTLNHQKPKIFPGLPNLEKLPVLKAESSQFHIFEYNGMLYFLSTSDEQNVIKYNIAGNYHRKITDSKFPMDETDLLHSTYFERSLYASSFR